MASHIKKKKKNNNYNFTYIRPQIPLMSKIGENQRYNKTDC